MDQRTIHGNSAIPLNWHRQDCLAPIHLEFILVWSPRKRVWWASMHSSRKKNTTVAHHQTFPLVAIAKLLFLLIGHWEGFKMVHLWHVFNLTNSQQQSNPRWSFIHWNRTLVFSTRICRYMIGLYLKNLCWFKSNCFLSEYVFSHEFSSGYMFLILVASSLQRYRTEVSIDLHRYARYQRARTYR